MTFGVRGDVDKLQKLSVGSCSTWWKRRGKVPKTDCYVLAGIFREFLHGFSQGVTPLREQASAQRLPQGPS